MSEAVNQMPNDSIPEAALVQSGMNAPRPAAAKGGFLPVPLDQVLVRALAGMPIHLAAGPVEAGRFTLYCAKDARFTEFHKRRLQEVAVRMIYLPLDCHARFRQQVERELPTIVTDATLSISTRAALVYQTSLELVEDILAHRAVGPAMPRLKHVAESVASFVLQEPKAFSLLFAHAQHDFYTATHMLNVGLWMVCLAHATGIVAREQLESACLAGMVHDVGKLLIPEDLLNKTETVTQDEWKVLRSHAEKSHEHLSEQGVKDEMILRVALEHHERLDGSGYPKAIKAEQMHVMSKIAAVVDSFDAMTACRPFKNRVKTIAEAVAVLQGDAPAKYDEKIVEAWVKLLKRAAADGAFRESVENAGATGRRREKRHAIDCPAQLRVLTNSGSGWTEGPAQAAKAHNISRRRRIGDTCQAGGCDRQLRARRCSRARGLCRIGRWRGRWCGCGRRRMAGMNTVSASASRASRSRRLRRCHRMPLDRSDTAQSLKKLLE